jgi:hypothetical protein
MAVIWASGSVLLLLSAIQWKLYAKHPRCGQTLAIRFAGDSFLLAGIAAGKDADYGSWSKMLR